LFQEFVEASDLALGGPAAVRGEAIIATPAIIFGLGWPLSFANFGD
jgi:hypothetical protein